MRNWLLSLLFTAPLFALAQSSAPDLPTAPLPSSASLTLAIAGANPGLFQAQAAPPNQQQPLIDPAPSPLRASMQSASLSRTIHALPRVVFSLWLQGK